MVSGEVVKFEEDKKNRKVPMSPIQRNLGSEKGNKTKLGRIFHILDARISLFERAKSINNDRWLYCEASCNTGTVFQILCQQKCVSPHVFPPSSKVTVAFLLLHDKSKVQLRQNPLQLVRSISWSHKTKFFAH